MYIKKNVLNKIFLHITTYTTLFPRRSINKLMLNWMNISFLRILCESLNISRSDTTYITNNHNAYNRNSGKIGKFRNTIIKVQKRRFQRGRNRMYSIKTISLPLYKRLAHKLNVHVERHRTMCNKILTLFSWSK